MMNGYDHVNAAFIIDSKGCLNKVSVELIQELDIYRALEVHILEVHSNQEFESCRITLNERFNFEIDVNNPIKDGADVLVKQCYISENTAELLVKEAFKETKRIAFGKVLH